MSSTYATWRGITITIPVEIVHASPEDTLAYERQAFADALNWSVEEVDAEREREAALVAAARASDALAALRLDDLVPRQADGGEGER